MSAKDKAKTVLGFLVCSSAFSQRNVSSVGLVVIFFAVYILAGGKVTTKLPALHQAVAAKGGLLNVMKEDAMNTSDPEDGLREEMPDLTAKESKSVLGIEKSKDRLDRAAVVHKRGKLFTKEEAEEGLKEEIDEEGLVKGANFVNRREQWKLERSERKPTDSLSMIEERLKIRRR